MAHYFVVDGKHLRQVNQPEFVEEGAEVLRVVLAGGEEHLFDASTVKPKGTDSGVLELYAGNQWVRSYGSFLYVDHVAFFEKRARVW